MSEQGEGQDDGEAAAGDGAAAARQPLRLLGEPGPGAAGPAAPVRLVREYKGLTVADLLRDEIADRLPGQLRSALRQLQRGDLAAAERSLPGEFAPVLPGPGHLRSEQRRRRWLLAYACLLVGGGGLLWWWPW